MDDVLMQRVLWVATQIKAKNLPYSQTTYFNDCGTPACLGGYCAADPVFAAGGLGVYVLKGTGHKVPSFGMPGDELIGEDAMAALLGLTMDQASYIFGMPKVIAHLGGDIDKVNDIDNVIARVQAVIDGEIV